MIRFVAIASEKHVPYRESIKGWMIRDLKNMPRMGKGKLAFLGFTRAAWCFQVETQPGSEKFEAFWSADRAEVAAKVEELTINLPVYD